MDKNIIFKSIEEIQPKALNSRKKIEIYSAIGIDSNYYAIFILEAKSRFLRKNANELLDMFAKLVAHKEHNFKKKVLLISSPLCSKAKTFLNENGFNVYIDFKREWV